VELMLDGERVHMFKVTPAKHYYRHSKTPTAFPMTDLVDKDLHIRIPVKAGPHTLGVCVPQEPALAPCLKASASRISAL